MTKPRKKVQLNVPQLCAVMSKQPKKYLEWGRGTGKSTVLGWFMKEMVNQMPRGKFNLVGASFKQMLTVTLPSTIEGLEMFGIYKDIHYFVGQRANKKLGWDEPYQPPLRYDTCLHFYTGAVFQLISQDKNAPSGRGSNTDGTIGDEAALLEQEHLFNDVLTTMRGNDHRFGGQPLYQAEIFSSTTPMTSIGRWFIDQEKAAKSNPKETLFLRASALQNKHNLGSKWFKRMKEQAPTPMHYDAEIKNIRPKTILEGFYASLSRDNYYTDYSESYYERFGMNKPASITSEGDNDVDPTRELIISIDWGAAINSLIVMQRFPNTIKVLKSFYVLHPKIVDDLIKQEFLTYYAPHKRKRILFYYDRNGNSRRANSRTTLADDVVNILRKADWSVQKMTRGLDPSHYDKYLVINKALRNDDPRLPKVLINKDNNQELIVSLENAEAKRQGNEIKKNKAVERRRSIPRQYATDLSDAFDIPIYNIIKPLMKGKQEKNEITFL